MAGGAVVTVEMMGWLSFTPPATAEMEACAVKGGPWLTMPETEGVESKGE